MKIQYLLGQSSTLSSFALNVRGKETSTGLILFSMILYGIKHFEGYFDRYWNKLNEEKAIWLVMKFIQHFQILSISPSHHLRQTLHLPLT